MPPDWLDDEADAWDDLTCSEGVAVTLTAAGGSAGVEVYAILGPWAEQIDEMGAQITRRRRVQRCEATLHRAAVRAALEEQLGSERDLRPGDTLQPIDTDDPYYYDDASWRVAGVHMDAHGVYVASLERALPYDTHGEGAR